MKEELKTIDTLSFALDKGHKEWLSIECNMLIELFDEHGVKKGERRIHNTVTANGKAGLVNQVASAPSLAVIKAIAVGTGSPGSNALGAEIARVAYTTATSSSNVLTVVATFGAGVGTGALTEAGTFDTATPTSGNMWMSASFSVVNKASADSLQITWTLTVN